MNGAFVSNLLLFARLLRRAGVEVHHGRMADVIRALEWVGVRSRADLRGTLCALLVHRHEDLATFHEAFDLFFRAWDEPSTGLPLFSLGERPRAVAKALGGSPVNVEFEESVSTSADPARRAAAAYSDVEVSRTKDFAAFTTKELEEAARMLARLPWRLGVRRTRRWRASHAGAIDLRPVLRRNLMRGAELLELPRRRRRDRPRPIVVIGDVSGSMERYSRMLLHFVHGLASSGTRVEAFVFATRLTRVTRRLTDVHDWGGGTRIGESLRTFNLRWARRVMRNGPVVMIVSDGWDRGDPALLARELSRLRRSCRRLIWLNPLLGSATYEPLTRGMQAALPYVDDFLPARNLANLQQLAAHLAALPSGHGPYRHVRV